MPTLEQLNAYIDRLNQHDWYFDYSDDGNVWRRGNERRAQLVQHAQTHDIYQQSYNDWASYKYDRILKDTLDNRMDELRLQITTTKAEA